MHHNFDVVALLSMDYLLEKESSNQAITGERKSLHTQQNKPPWENSKGLYSPSWSQKKVDRIIKSVQGGAQHTKQHSKLCLYLLVKKKQNKSTQEEKLS